MKNSFMTGMILGLILAAVMLVGCGKDETEMPATPTEIGFAADYSSALAAGQEKDQKVLIEFYTDWCKWCKRLDSITFQDSAVIALSQNVVFAKINAEVDSATAKLYSVSGYPTILLLNSDGTEIDRIGGYLDPIPFVNEVNDYLKGVGTLDYFKALADTAGNPSIFMKVGDKYVDRGKYADAEVYYKKVIDTDPDNLNGHTPEAHLSMAEICRWTDRFDDAIKGYQMIMEKYKGTDTEADAELRLAVAFRQKGDTTLAISTFEGFLQHHPASEDTAYAASQIEKLKNPPAQPQ